MSNATGAVVVGVDDTAEGWAAVRLAFEEAAVRHTGVVLVRAWRRELIGDDGLRAAGELAAAALEHEADAVVSRVVGDGGDLAPVPWVRRVVAEGTPGAVLADASEQAEILVVGSRGRTGAAGLVLGSVSLHCALHATCPVAVVPHGSATPRPDLRPPAVVVGVDGSPGSLAALGWGVDESIRRRRPLRAVTIWHPDEIVRPTRTVVLADPRVRARAAATLSDAVAAAVATAGDLVDVEELVIDGSPHTTLVACAAPHDLLVLGSRGHGGFAGLLLGSVVQYALGRAPCPVVVVHGRR